MKNYRFILISLVVIFVFYMVQPIPYCKLEKNSINEYGLLLHGVGDSMYPTILNNSECLCIQKENYFLGDIVLFVVDIDGKLEKVLHRIIEIDGDEIHTKGDNNGFIDKKITEQNIVCAIPEIPRYETFS